MLLINKIKEHLISHFGVIIIVALGTISIIGSGGGGNGDDPPAAPLVLAVSGAEISLDGTWMRPCESGGGVDNDTGNTHVFSGASVIITEYSYTSTDGSCTGTETVDRVFDVTFSTGAVTAITGWVDFSGTTVSPPQAQDGSGALSNTESVTSLTYTVNSDTGGIPPGTQADKFFVVDDTLTGTLVMYDKDDSGQVALIDGPLTRQ